MDISGYLVGMSVCSTSKLLSVFEESDTISISNSRQDPLAPITEAIKVIYSLSTHPY